MKRLNISILSLLIAAMCISLSSCIYDAPGDKFYRTLWTSDEETFGQMTLDFLCDGNVCAKAENADLDDYGTYQSDGITATFKDLSLPIGNQTILLLQAHKNGDHLTLTCIDPTADTPIFIHMTRLSAYPD